MRFLIILLALLVVAGCQSKGVDEQPAGQSATIDGSDAAAPAGEAYSGIVVETMDAGGYTYVLVQTESGEQIWAAGPQQEMAVDDIVVIRTSMAMPEFHSETLERTFDMLYFVTDFGDPNDAKGHGTDMAAKAGSMGGGMPAGLQIIGGRFEDAAVLGVADAYQRVTDWHTHAPDLSGHPMA